MQALLWLTGFLCGALVVHMAYQRAARARRRRARIRVISIARKRAEWRDSVDRAKRRRSALDSKGVA